MRTDIHEDVHGTALPLSSRPRSFPSRNGPVPAPVKRMKIYRPLHQVSCLDPQALMRPVGEGNVLVERDTATLVEVCTIEESVGAGRCGVGGVMGFSLFEDATTTFASC